MNVHYKYNALNVHYERMVLRMEANSCGQTLNALVRI